MARSTDSTQYVAASVDPNPSIGCCAILLTTL